MHIPERLAELLKRDPALDGAVRLSIARFTPWIAHSHLPFFPEYTDHGLAHLAGVLRTSAGLIADEAWDVLTAGDAAVLTMSVLLHDCALHLSEDGFYALLAQGRVGAPRALPRDAPWNVLWEDFFAEARRFDGRTLTRLLGDAKPVRRPPEDARDLTLRDRLLIGEFLRRHHPRLAHEIALTGVPVPARAPGGTSSPSPSPSVPPMADPLVLEGFSGAQADFAVLAGLVARSHGMDVRALMPHLETRFGARQYRGVHPVFLMALLRVADYLQLDAERAPRQMLRVKRLVSPVSQGEWTAHHAIRDIRTTHDDPEAIFVDTLPEDVHTFLRVQSWLTGIQREIDASWAVLGETHGRHEELRKLGLVIRRVRSSLDQLDAFAARVDYVPVRAAFRAADADLLKVLIEPLYGNKPEIGLRELIQNSVDAVRELEQYLEDVPDARRLPRPTLAGDVVAAIERNEAGDIDVIVSDRGIGMTQRVVTDYFLAAGASFRRSEEWRKTFETSEGKSRVLRAGRFGVGALASFLIGPTIEVSTRHVDDPHGLAFTASVDTDVIELRRVDRPIGTTIRIRADRTRIEPLTHLDNAALWDWFLWSTPSVVRTLFGERLEQRYLVPEPSGPALSGWHRTSHPAYADVFWSYSTPRRTTFRSDLVLSCNGIAILGEREPSPVAESWTARHALDLPCVVVVDPDGQLPLTLQRTSLAGDVYPFDEELVADIARDFVAFALVNGARSGKRESHPGRATARLRAGLKRQTDWYFLSDGFGLAEACLLSDAESLLLVDSSLENVALSVDRPTLRTSSLLMTISQLADAGRGRDGLGPWAPIELPQRGLRILIAYSRIASYVKNDPFLADATQVWARNGWSLVSVGACQSSTFDFERFAETNDANAVHFASVAELYLAPSTPTASTLASEWLRLLGRREIPYDMARRRTELKHAFGELAPYVQAYERAARLRAETDAALRTPQRRKRRARLK